MDKFYTEKELEEMFKRIKTYLNLNPKRTKFQVSGALNIPIEVINEFIKDGRLDEKFLDEPRSLVRKSNINEEKRKELLDALNKENDKYKNSLKYGQNNLHSQLVTDLNHRDKSKTNDNNTDQKENEK